MWNFSVLTGISNDYLTEVMSGKYNNGSNVNPDNTRTVKSWYESSKAATLSQAQEQNSVGSIFIAKAAYGMQETPQVLKIDGSGSTLASPEQIAEKYRSEKPKIPELENVESV